MPMAYRRHVLRKWLGLRWRLLIGADDSQVNQRIFGHQIRATTAKSYELLFREMFIDLDYWIPDLGPAPVIVDCGCNIGMSILFFKSQHPDARVIAFEPNSTSFELLQDNTVGNGMTGVELHNCALGAENGEIEFFIDPENPMSLRASTVEARMPAGRTRVAQRRLSDFLDGPVDLVKMDIEGAEAEVISELVESGAIDRIQRFILEYHHHIDPADDRLASFLELLEQAGFGYQVHAHRQFFNHAWRRGRTFQDIAIFAYRKDA